MSSKQNILKAIAHANVPPSALPEIIPDFKSGIFTSQEGLAQQFSANLHKIGGASILVDSYEGLIKDFITRFKGLDHIYNAVEGLSLGDIFLKDVTGAHELESINVALIKGAFGVAENGAIWIHENELPFRVLPFICQHLVLVLDRKDIVENLHMAYKSRAEFDTAYGVFIAGPSKTADIEQSLVIGAHGARSLTVYLF